MKLVSFHKKNFKINKSYRYYAKKRDRKKNYSFNM